MITEPVGVSRVTVRQASDSVERARAIRALTEDLLVRVETVQAELEATLVRTRAARNLDYVPNNVGTTNGGDGNKPRPSSPIPLRGAGPRRS